MPANIVTTDDLRLFKEELLAEIADLVPKKYSPKRQWIKSADVKKMLGISTGTLQHLRINGTIPYSKLGGIILYDYDKIIKVLEDHRQ